MIWERDYAVENAAAAMADLRPYQRYRMSKQFREYSCFVRTSPAFSRGAPVHCFMS